MSFGQFFVGNTQIQNFFQCAGMATVSEHSSACGYHSALNSLFNWIASQDFLYFLYFFSVPDDIGLVNIGVRTKDFKTIFLKKKFKYSSTKQYSVRKGKLFS
jgi:hypothetical protein